MTHWPITCGALAGRSTSDLSRSLEARRQQDSEIKTQTAQQHLQAVNDKFNSEYATLLQRGGDASASQIIPIRQFLETPLVIPTEVGRSDPEELFDRLINYVTAKSIPDPRDLKADEPPPKTASPFGNMVTK